jgi:hypothetical protein
MNASISALANDGLLFRWEAPRARRAAILFFLIASLLAHAFCFYLFQIIYPPTVTLLPPPARVSLITSDAEEGRTLLRWIEAEDPALAFTTLRPFESRLRALPKIGHVPSYMTNELILKQPPPLPVDLSAPSSQPPAPVPIVHRSAAPAAGVISTTVSFSDEFNILGAPDLPRPKFTASNNEPPQSVRFRIAVGTDGEVRYCFPLSTSGDTVLDQQAHDFIMLARFQERPKAEKGGDTLLWGMATIDWGNDVVAPTAPSPGPSPP